MKITKKIIIPTIIILAVAMSGGYYLLQRYKASNYQTVADPAVLVTQYPKSTLDTEKVDRLFKNAQVCDDYEPQIQPDLAEMHKQGKAVIQYTYVENSCIKTGQVIVIIAEADARIQNLRSQPDIAAADYVTGSNPD